MIEELVALARKYTPEEWAHAAYIAATQEVDDACMRMRQISLRGER